MDKQMPMPINKIGTARAMCKIKNPMKNCSKAAMEASVTSRKTIPSIVRPNLCSTAIAREELVAKCKITGKKMFNAKQKNIERKKRDKNF